MYLYLYLKYMYIFMYIVYILLHFQVAKMGLIDLTLNQCYSQHGLSIKNVVIDIWECFKLSLLLQHPKPF